MTQHLRLLVAAASLFVPAVLAAQSANPDIQNLFAQLNTSREERGLPALAYDGHLATAAQLHADLMASEGVLDHQLPGEPDLAQRCNSAGAHFAAIAENIAEGGNSMRRLHEGWLHSPGHYANMMSAEYTVVGIGIARGGGRTFAVEDFGLAVVAQSRDSIEARVRDMLAIRNINPSRDSNQARKACAYGNRYFGGGEQPGMILQFTSSNVDELGPVLDRKLSPGKYRSASVGACNDGDSRGFTRYKVTLLFY